MPAGVCVPSCRTQPNGSGGEAGLLFDCRNGRVGLEQPVGERGVWGVRMGMGMGMGQLASGGKCGTVDYLSTGKRLCHGHCLPACQLSRAFKVCQRATWRVSMAHDGSM